MADRADGPTIVAVANDDFRAPRELVMHQHARGQLFASSLGLLTVETEAGRWLMPPQRALWVPPGARHGALARGASQGWSLYVSPRASGELPSKPVVMQITPLLGELIARVAGWAPKHRALTAEEERLCLVLLDEIRSAPREALHVPMPKSPKLLEVARQLLESPDDVRGVEAWARRAAASKRTFTRHFRAETGLSFASWRTQVRMFVALERLAAGASVTRLATDLGYESPSAFTSAFRRALGVPPSRYASAALAQSK